MSEFSGITSVRRGQVLLIVEGEKQEPKFLSLLSGCFPELSISQENVITYRTNIYRLYNDIIREYGETCFEDKDDIDLPFVVTRNDAIPLRKTNFTDIILIFDYERQDSCYSEKKITEMQNYFSDTTDMGKLYINYPMLESYKDFNGFPDSSYQHKKVFVSPHYNLEDNVTIGEYKRFVFDTYVDRNTGFHDRLKGILQNNGLEESRIDDVLKCLLCLRRDFEETILLDQIESILKPFYPLEETLKNRAYQVKGEILRRGYYQIGLNYWEFLRTIFKNIIIANICKANMIQDGKYDIASEALEYNYHKLDYSTILHEQNRCSAGTDGFIWILNTSVFFVIDYNFGLIEE